LFFFKKGKKELKIFFKFLKIGYTNLKWMAVTNISVNTSSKRGETNKIELVTGYLKD